MGASAWVVKNQSKHEIGLGTFNLSAGTSLRMSLHTSAASTNLAADITVYASIGSEVTGGGYSNIDLSGLTWGFGQSSGQQKFDFTDPVFTAVGADISNVRYAAVWHSASAGGGKILMYAALSTLPFDITDTNTLTVQLASTGAWTLE